MELVKDNFIINYDENLSYVPELIDYLESGMNNIMNYFELDKLKSKRKVIIYNDIELYKKHVEKYHKYYDYICADTFDGNINILSIEEAHKTKEHANMTIDDLKRVILHEFVHICQQDSQIEKYNETITWFWEALATNLGNPENFNIKIINSDVPEIKEFGSLKNNYSIAFTIGNYLFDNYSKEEILEFVKYPSKLLLIEDKVLEEAKEWSNNKINKR